jgi:hypothetical protein
MTEKKCPFALPVRLKLPWLDQEGNEYGNYGDVIDAENCVILTEILREHGEAIVEAINGYYGEEKPVATKIIDSLGEFSDALKNDENIQEKFRCTNFKSSNVSESIDVMFCKIIDQLKTIEGKLIEKNQPAVVADFSTFYHEEMAKLKQRNEELEKERDDWISYVECLGN